MPAMMDHFPSWHIERQCNGKAGTMDIVDKLREKPYRRATETDDAAKIRRQREREEGADEIERLRARILDLEVEAEVAEHSGGYGV